MILLLLTHAISHDLSVMDNACWWHNCAFHEKSLVAESSPIPRYIWGNFFQLCHIGNCRPDNARRERTFQDHSLVDRF